MAKRQHLDEKNLRTFLLDSVYRCLRSKTTTFHLFFKQEQLSKVFFKTIKIFQPRLTSSQVHHLYLQDRDALPDKYFIEGEAVVIVHPLRGQKTGTVADPHVNWSLGRIHLTFWTQVFVEMLLFFFFVAG